MWASKGILTSRGGVTSHAAVVARGWGKPCVVGCDDIEINEEEGTMRIKSTGKVFKEGDTISINGSTGEVIGVAIETTTPTLAGSFGKLLGWADEVDDSLKVMANADSGPDAAKALELGAKGIGLCRTEHMFFTPPDRLPIVRRWILRGEGLDKVQEFQRADFKDILYVMDGKPVTIRLLDPPLHEFLPRASEVTANFTKSLGYNTKEDLINDIESMHEENPMLGLRGCRLAIVHSELSVNPGGTSIPILAISCRPSPLPPKIFLSGLGIYEADPPNRNKAGIKLGSFSAPSLRINSGGGDLTVAAVRPRPFISAMVALM